VINNAFPAIESLRLEVNGHRVHYRKAGNGPPVMLIHGGASDSRDWVNTMEALAGHYGLYAPDLIGFGLSERNSTGYYLSDFSEFLLGFIEKLGLERPALVGHSFGARVCLEVALHHPEKLSRLVLVDAAGLGKVSRFGNALLTAFWALRRLWRQPQPYPKFLSHDGEDPKWLCTDELPGLRVPTLIVWKRHDLYLPISIARRAEALIPGARLAVLPGYGHAPHGQNPQAFNSLLLDFLNHD
jgi:pimeloyl-ACP methyl ester carboxylesterase